MKKGGRLRDQIILILKNMKLLGFPPRLISIWHLIISWSLSLDLGWHAWMTRTKSNCSLPMSQWSPWHRSELPSRRQTLLSIFNQEQSWALKVEQTPPTPPPPSNTGDCSRRVSLFVLNHLSFFCPQNTENTMSSSLYVFWSFTIAFSSRKLIGSFEWFINSENDQFEGTENSARPSKHICFWKCQ